MHTPSLPPCSTAGCHERASTTGPRAAACLSVLLGGDGVQLRCQADGAGVGRRQLRSTTAALLQCLPCLRADAARGCRAGEQKSGADLFQAQARRVAIKLAVARGVATARHHAQCLGLPNAITQLKMHGHNPHTPCTLAGSSLPCGHNSCELSTGSGAASTPPLVQPSSQASGTKRPRSPALKGRRWAGADEKQLKDRRADKMQTRASPAHWNQQAGSWIRPGTACCTVNTPVGASQPSSSSAQAHRLPSGPLPP